MRLTSRPRYPIAVAGVIAVAAAGAIAAGAWWAVRPARPGMDDAEAVPRPPRISPDYAGIALPPNIAPLDFAVREDGEQFFVRMEGEAGEAIEILSRSPAIIIPPRRWRALVDANRGRDLRWTVYAEADGRWRRYEPIVNRVAEDEIDPYLVYRLIPPLHTRWIETGIYQRNLENFDQSTVLEGKSFGSTCVNCHSFPGNDPRRMLLGVRSESYGATTLLADEGRVTKLGAPFGYTVWHPGGQIAAYAKSKVRQFFHTSGPEVRDAVDLVSTLAYLRLDTLESKPVPGASDPQDLSTNPTWSADGRWLYYCRAPMLWTDREAVPPDRYAEVKYDLMRIPYNAETDRWGSPEMVLSAKETGKSILLPRVSPDGRFLLFCMCEYGCFPPFQSTSDLYLMDLEKGTYWKPPINSECSESWHSWSSNSRWIAFGSKRGGGIFTHCYLSYVDSSGAAFKPFVLPQADPEFYDSFLKVFSIPELVTGPVPVSTAALIQGVRSDATGVSAPPAGRPAGEVEESYRQPEH